LVLNEQDNIVRVAFFILDVIGFLVGIIGLLQLSLRTSLLGGSVLVVSGLITAVFGLSGDALVVGIMCMGLGVVFSVGPMFRKELAYPTRRNFLWFGFLFIIGGIVCALMS
jgi:hypothetical protein